MAFSIVGPSSTDSTSQSLIWNGKRRHGPIGIVHPRWSMRDGAPGQSIRDGPSGMIRPGKVHREYFPPAMVHPECSIQNDLSGRIHPRPYARHQDGQSRRERTERAQLDGTCWARAREGEIKDLPERHAQGGHVRQGHAGGVTWGETKSCGSAAHRGIFRRGILREECRCGRC